MTNHTTHMTSNFGKNAPACAPVFSSRRFRISDDVRDVDCKNCQKAPGYRAAMRRAEGTPRDLTRKLRYS